MLSNEHLLNFNGKTGFFIFENLMNIVMIGNETKLNLFVKAPLKGRKLGKVPVLVGLIVVYIIVPVFLLYAQF